MIIHIREFVQHKVKSVSTVIVLIILQNAAEVNKLNETQDNSKKPYQNNNHKVHHIRVEPRDDEIERSLNMQTAAKSSIDDEELESFNETYNIYAIKSQKELK